MADISIESSLGVPPNIQKEQELRKRKASGDENEQEPLDANGSKRRQLGPFVVADDEDDDDDMDALNDADMGGYFLEPKANRLPEKELTPDPESLLMRETEEDQDELDALNEAHGERYIFGDRSDKTAHKTIQNTYIPPDLTRTTTTISESLENRAREPPRQRSRPSVKYSIRTCSGKVHHVGERKPNSQIPYEQLIAARSTITNPRRARKNYYGIPIHDLLDTVAAQDKAAMALGIKPRIHQSMEPTPTAHNQSRGVIPSLLWTEKYRAKKFIDLIGDDRTHRSVLRWLKSWDKVVFPGLTKTSAATSKTMSSMMDRQKRNPQAYSQRNDWEDKKILLLTGPPGLGKTTLAHVCARQAGYEVMEINASDERGRNVVKHRIRDAIGTENVKTVSGTRSNKPICVVVDEVDGVVGGSNSGGGEGGFVKALVDLVQLDKKNSTNTESNSEKRKKKKGDKFRLLRPIILICNDLYHPTLRPLRSSFLAEIVHTRPAPVDKVVNRMKYVFQQESVPFDTDGIRRLCEATWGIGGVRERTINSRGMGEGDIRGVLVAGQWVASKLKSAASLGDSKAKLSKKWVESQLKESSKDLQGLGRGGAREIVERVFLEDAGFPPSKIAGNSSSKSRTSSLGAGESSVGIGNSRKHCAMEGLQRMIEASGEHDRCISDCFSTYPTYTFQDDTFLSKPRAAYEWLQFHDEISSKVFSNQSWELNGYLTQSVLAFHHLFASSRPQNTLVHKKNNEGTVDNEHPFSGIRADFAAFEAGKQTRAVLTEFQTSLSPHLLRAFRSKEVIATELVPVLMRMLSPDVKPTVVGGTKGSFSSVRREGERALVRSAVRVMRDFDIKFVKTRVERDDAVRPDGGWVYRMEPPLDTLVTYSNVKDDMASAVRVRYAVRQLLAQEYSKEMLRQTSETEAAQTLGSGSHPAQTKTRGRNNDQDRKEEKDPASNGPQLKRDFFGRIIKADSQPASKSANNSKGNQKGQRSSSAQSQNHAWVSYHEGFSNAVRKRISLGELMDGFVWPRDQLHVLSA